MGSYMCQKVFLLVSLIGILIAYLLAPLGEFLPNLIQKVYEGDAYGLAQELNHVGASFSYDSHLAVHDPKILSPQREALHAASTTIVQEYNSFRSNHKIPYFGDLDPNQQFLGQWKTLWLKLYGTESCVASQYFPKTVAAVQASGLPAVSIMISTLDPGQILEPHYGPTNFILRYHMGLSIPQTITNTTSSSSEDSAPPPPLPPHLTIWPCRPTGIYWDSLAPNCTPLRLEWKSNHHNHHEDEENDGGSSSPPPQEMYFDDTFYHSASNPNPDQERIILWLDLKRHDYKGWRQSLLSHLIFLIVKWFPPQEIRTNVETTNRLCRPPKQ